MTDIPFLRTPASNFDNLPGYRFNPHYLQVEPGNLRMHYVDEDPESEHTILMPHTTLKNGGHFIQEDSGEEWTYIIVRWINA